MKQKILALLVALLSVSQVNAAKLELADFQGFENNPKAYTDGVDVEDSTVDYKGALKSLAIDGKSFSVIETSELVGAKSVVNSQSLTPMKKALWNKTLDLMALQMQNYKNEDVLKGVADYYEHLTVCSWVYFSQYRAFAFQKALDQLVLNDVDKVRLLSAVTKTHSLSSPIPKDEGVMEDWLMRCSTLVE